MPLNIHENISEINAQESAKNMPMQGSVDDRTTLGELSIFNDKEKDGGASPKRRPAQQILDD